MKPALLLRPETQTVAVVEAKKTAVVASMFFLDLGAEEIWAEKAREIPVLNNSVISQWLNNYATEEMR